MLLHKLQLEESLGKGNVHFSNDHVEAITSVLYDLVKDTKTCSRDDISFAEMRKISDKAYDKLCKGDFWSEITDRPIDKAYDKGSHNLEQGVDTDAMMRGVVV